MRAARVVLASLAACAAALLASGGASAAPSAALDVEVLDADGAPVAGADVALVTALRFDEPETADAGTLVRAATGADGRARLDVPAYPVGVVARTADALDLAALRTAPPPGLPLRLVLVRGATSPVRIEDPAGRACAWTGVRLQAVLPVDECLLFLDLDARDGVRTPPARGLVDAWRPGAELRAWSDALAAEPAPYEEDAAQGSVALALAPLPALRTVRGRAVTADGRPVADALVVSDARPRKPARTGRDGRFGVGARGLVRLFHPRFPPTEAWRPREGGRGDAGDVVLRETAAVVGTVRDADGRTPSAGAVCFDGVVAPIGAAGAFRIDGASSNPFGGILRLHAFATRDGAALLRRCGVAARSEDKVDVVLSPGVTLRLRDEKGAPLRVPRARVSFVRDGAVARALDLWDAEPFSEIRLGRAYVPRTGSTRVVVDVPGRAPFRSDGLAWKDAEVVVDVKFEKTETAR